MKRAVLCQYRERMSETSLVMCVKVCVVCIAVSLVVSSCADTPKSPSPTASPRSSLRWSLPLNHRACMEVMFESQRSLQGLFSVEEEEML